MKKKLFVVATLLAFVTSLSATTKVKEEDPLVQLKKLNQTVYSIYNMYVDSVSTYKLVEKAIKSMLEELDPHSTYFDADEAEKMNSQIEGNFGGIGIQYQILRDTLYVVQVMAGCPADRVGMRAGDRIIKVNGKNISGVKMPASEITTLIRGEVGTSVRLAVNRDQVGSEIVFNVKRDKIPVYSLDAAYMIAPGVGYIKLNCFASTTVSEFYNAINELQAQGMKQLMLDLQGNGGGLLYASVQLADEFLPKDRLIVYTLGNQAPKHDYYATNKGSLEKIDLVVLIDESSASASEILSGALQDWDRAVLVGRRSFGKGLVQSPIDLVDGSLIRLTVARYYTPCGRNIQKPYDGGTEKYHRELENRYKHGELQSMDSINFPDSLKYKTRVLGRTIYGGGGIMPDVFVPMDTTNFTNYYRDILAKGDLNKTVLEYLNRNREKIHAQYPTFEEYNANFVVDKELLDQLIANGEADEVKFNAEEFEKSKEYIKLLIKALIARDSYDSKYYFEVMNQNNEIVKRGLEVMKSYKNYLK